MRAALSFGHPAMSFYAFAAGASRYGIRAAADAARMYGVPFDVCLSYLRRYSAEGYTV